MVCVLPLAEAGGWIIWVNRLEKQRLGAEEGRRWSRQEEAMWIQGEPELHLFCGLKEDACGP